MTRLLLIALWIVPLACAPPPALDSVEPSQGPIDRVVSLTLHGQGFVEGAQVRLVGISFDFELGVEPELGATQLRATVPAGIEPGSYDVVLENPDGARARLAAGYQAVAAALTLVVLDVGQGDALLAVGTDGTTLLVDGGKENRDRTVLWPALEHYAGGRLDGIVVSHFDIDHMGGVVGLLRGLDGTAGTADDPELPLGLWDNGRAGACETAICARYREAAAGRARTLAVGDRFELGAASARCVAVNGALEGGQQFSPEDNNAASVGLVFELGGASLLVSGDLPGGGLGFADLETPLAQALGSVDVWHLNHHGSASSTAASALAQLSPRATLISVGRDNSYCHPAQIVLDRLDATGRPVYLTQPGVTVPSANCSAASSLGEAMQVVGDIVVRFDASGGVTIQEDRL